MSKSIRGFSVKVTTLSGAKHIGRELTLQSDGVVIRPDGVFGYGAATNVPWEEIARIEIRHGKHAFDFTICSALFAVIPAVYCGSGVDLACLATPVFFAGGAAVAAASAPFTLAADGVRLLIPPKVYAIVH